MDAETTGTTPPAASPAPHARVAQPERVHDGGRLTSAASMRERSSTADTGTMTGADGLARELADLAQTLQASPSAEEAMHAVLTAAVRLVPGADEAAISLVRARGRVTSAAATGPAGKRLDDLQTELGQGPCLDAVLTHRSTRVDDLFHDDRWPLLSAHAEEIGMPSMLCLQLHTDAGDLGALNLLGTRRAAFSDASEHVGLLLATHAAVAISGARELRHMVSVLASRDVIGQAKGILMERFKMSPDQAFEVLAQASQDHNRKLVDIAADLAATGELPRPPAPSRRRPHRR